MKKTIYNFLLVIFLILLVCMPVNSLTVFAASKKQDKIYVSLGDDFAKGNAINFSTKDENEDLIIGTDGDYDFIENSYADKTYNYLKTTYTYTQGYDFSHSGDTCEDLVNFIFSFYSYANNACINSSDYNTRFTTLTNLQVYNVLSKAKTITICIGANDVLDGMDELIARYLGKATPSITYEEIEEALKTKIIDSSGLSENTFEQRFKQLLNILYKLNSGAEIYFTSMYNPYKVLDIDSNLSSTLDQSKLDNITKLTEQALAGALKDSNENRYYGINEIIQTNISRYNANLNSNFKYVNIKSSFDSVILAGRTEYKRYVNTCLDELTLSDVANYNDYLDPHATYLGHELIFNAYKNVKIGTKYIKDTTIEQILIIISGICLFLLLLITLPITTLKKSKRKIC